MPDPPPLREVNPRHADEVLRLDGEHQQGLGLGIRAGGGVEVRLKLNLGDLHAVRLEHDLRPLTLGGGDAEEFATLGGADDEGEHRPRLTLGEGLNLATETIGDALLDGGEVGEVNPRAVDARADLLQDDRLELGGGLGVGAIRQADELTLAGVAHADEGAGVGGEVSRGGADEVEPRWSVFHNDTIEVFFSLHKHFLFFSDDLFFYFCLC